MEKRRKLSPDRDRNKYVQRYKSEWESKLKWLKKGSNDLSAFCKYCNLELVIGKGGKKDLERHATTQSHIRKEKDVSTSSSLTTHFSRENYGAVDADLRWANFVAENNLPVLLSDNFTKLVPKMFPDSTIATSFRSSRTKTSLIIKQALGEPLRENVVSLMKSMFFTLMIDESTDITTTRQMVIMVRVFSCEDDKVQTLLYKIIEIEGRATGEGLFNIVDKSFKEDGILWSNCISMSSDGAKAMVGQFNSVLSRVKNEQTNVWFLHCSCHIAHLAASHACSELPDVCEQLARDVYTFFKTSGKRQDDYKLIQTLLEIETHKILRPSATRWLCTLQCVERLIEQWPALTEYFDTKMDAKECKLDQVVRIKATLHSDAAKLYFYFLQANLPKFTIFNTMMQHEEPFIHKLYSETRSLLRRFIASFVKFEVIQRNDITDIDTSRCNQLSDDSLFVGHKTKTLLEGGVINNNERAAFFANVRNFFVKGTSELYRLLPLQDEVLKNISVLDPSEKKNGEWNKLEKLIDQFPNVVLEDDRDQLQTEYMDYCLWESPVSLPSDRIDVYWGAVSRVEENGKPRFPTLGSLAKAMLILPHGNADVERMFSKLTNIKTTHRNSLSSDMLNALMHCSSRKVGADFQPTDTMRKRARNLKQ